MPRPINSVPRMMENSIQIVNGCWSWTGPVGHNGYGKCAINKKSKLAHRVFYQHFKGEIQSGNQIDHLCKNRLCVNPEHLEEVTAKENNLRSESPSAINAKKTHCINGHEFTVENTYVSKLGRRNCRACARNNIKRFKEKNCA